MDRELARIGRAVTEVVEGQARLRSDFERLAGAVTPLLSDQYENTLNRVRALEQRILLRQERPTVVRLAALVAAAARIGSDADARSHLTEGILDALYQLGYEQFGAVGDPYDDRRHEAVGGGSDGTDRVTVVHAPGLQSFDDVIIRARVEVGGHGPGTTPPSGPPTMRETQL